jgi:hypothetical protein
LPLQARKFCGKVRVNVHVKTSSKRAVIDAANRSKYYLTILASKCAANFAAKLMVNERQMRGKSPGKFDATF